ncbi:MAG TPA: hypothetical protein VNX68_06600 [Nitrosopumilaceae archaeon]|nr:hypothetical protein [Nitrosopumilaceae archaeon]
MATNNNGKVTGKLKMAINVKFPLAFPAIPATRVSIPDNAMEDKIIVNTNKPVSCIIDPINQQ